MWDHEYDDSILEKFKGNKKAMLAQTLGLKREAFELRLLSSKFFTMDIFLMYNLNESFQWNGKLFYKKNKRKLIVSFTLLRLSRSS
jgi:hypothetical protein